MSCTLCPRGCGVDRERGELGACGVPATLRVARAALHFWEEPCLSGTRGSGAVFFSGCSLGCVFCQNREISHGGFGKEITEEQLTEILLSLAAQGAHNINLVTPDQFTPAILSAVKMARKRGLTLPIVCNCSGYQRVETIRALSEAVDIWLPDLKYLHAPLARKYSAAPDYPEVAKTAIAEMVRLTAERGGELTDSEGIMQRGVIVRHMMLPGSAIDSRRILKYLHDTYGDTVRVSFLSQYTPPRECEKSFPAELTRPVNRGEYSRLVAYAAALGMTRVYVQKGEAVSDSFVPPFDLTGVR